MKLFVFVFLFCSQGFAWEIKFEQRNHLGAQSVDVASENKGVYSFGGKKLGKKIPAAIQTAFKEIAKGPAPDPKTKSCYLGAYTFTKKNSKVTSKKGCVHGETYSRYMKQLSVVRNYAKGS